MFSLLLMLLLLRYDLFRFLYFFSFYVGRADIYYALMITLVSRYILPPPHFIISRFPSASHTQRPMSLYYFLAAPSSHTHNIDTMRLLTITLTIHTFHHYARLYTYWFPYIFDDVTRYLFHHSAVLHDIYGYYIYFLLFFFILYYIFFDTWCLTYIPLYIL